MSGNQFIPHTKREADRVVADVLQSPEYNDSYGLSDLFLSVARNALIALVFLLPLFFLPGLFGTLGFGKVLLTLSLGVVIVSVVSLVALRRKYVATILPKPIGVFLLAVVIALCSALLSGDTLDATRGSFMEPQTVGFLALMGLMMILPLVLQDAKAQAMKVLLAFAVAAALLLSYVLVRILFGATFLSFGSFNTVTLSPLGNFNDLALFAGLLVIASLITLAQLPVKGLMQYAVAALLGMGLLVLAVVNFFNIWIVLGFVGLLLFMYLISRDTLFSNESTADQPPVSKVLILLTAIVCVVSTVFIVSGGSLGERISEVTGVNYVEVRPSFSATIDVLRGVYSENALLGVGPNRFADAWRMHKDVSINQTIFWDTDFNSGNGFAQTFFVNTGILGGILLLVFHGWFFLTGSRMLLKPEKPDRFWYFFGLLSFSSAVFIWGMSYVYVPGATILLLGAFFTGCTFVAAAALLPSTQYKIALATNQRRGFIMMSIIIFVITGSIATLYSVGEQYVAQSSFNESRVSATEVTQIEATAQRSFATYPDDRFVRTLAQVQLATLNGLLNLPSPTEAEQQRFLQAAQLGIQYGEAAVRTDENNPDNYAVLASIYGALSVAGIEDTQERAVAVLNQARQIDPLNPIHWLIEAQVYASGGDTESARSALVEALTLKNNFTEALFLATQIEINEGNIDSAISSTQALVSLEPNNPTRYYQLGMLLVAAEETEAAIQAYERAIALDPQYANARYMLALSYLNSGRDEEALTELRIVAETNADNEQLQALIQQVESGNFEIIEQSSVETPVAESSDVETINDAVVTDGETGTDLITPVNTVNEEPVADAQEAETVLIEAEAVDDGVDTDEATEAGE